MSCQDSIEHRQSYEESNYEGILNDQHNTSFQSTEDSNGDGIIIDQGAPDDSNSARTANESFIITRRELFQRWDKLSRSSKYGPHVDAAKELVIEYEGYYHSSLDRNSVVDIFQRIIYYFHKKLKQYSNRRPLMLDKCKEWFATRIDLPVGTESILYEPQTGDPILREHSYPWLGPEPEPVPETRLEEIPRLPFPANIKRRRKRGRQKLPKPQPELINQPNTTRSKRVVNSTMSPDFVEIPPEVPYHRTKEFSKKCMRGKRLEAGELAEKESLEKISLALDYHFRKIGRRSSAKIVRYLADPNTPPGDSMKLRKFIESGLEPKEPKVKRIHTRDVLKVMIEEAKITKRQYIALRKSSIFQELLPCYDSLRKTRCSLSRSVVSTGPNNEEQEELGDAFDSLVEELGLREDQRDILTDLGIEVTQNSQVSLTAQPGTSQPSSTAQPMIIEVHNQPVITYSQAQIMPTLPKKPQPMQDNATELKNSLPELPPAIVNEAVITMEIGQMPQFFVPPSNYYLPQFLAPPQTTISTTAPSTLSLNYSNSQLYWK